MFSIGERVVYPMYGAGVIEGIEDKVIDGETMTYYVLKIPIGDLTLMVSTAKAERNGIRSVTSPDKVKTIVKEAGTIEMSNNWNLRYKENMDTLRTGDFFKIMEVFKTLILKERVKSLSSIEKKLLGTTKQIILSEIILSQNIDKPEAEHLLMEGVALSAG